MYRMLIFDALIVSFLHRSFPLPLAPLAEHGSVSSGQYSLFGCWAPKWILFLCQLIGAHQLLKFSRLWQFCGGRMESVVFRVG